MSRFCTAASASQPCGRRALPGQSFCYSHHPTRVAPRPCGYFNLRGEPCCSPALRGQDHCFTHSPRNHRLREPALPIVPRTRRQRARLAARLFYNLPESLRTLPNLPPVQ